MDDYKVVCLCFDGLMNVGVVAIIVFVCWSIVRYEALRMHILESAQDGDKVTHWSDGKNVVSLILGLFSAWFTGNLTMIFVTYKMFEVGPGAVVTLFVAVTFTLLGIAWKKP